MKLLFLGLTLLFLGCFEKETPIEKKQRLLGKDENKNYIRDDIEEWIDEKTKDHSRELNLGLKQYAKYETLILLHYEDKALQRKYLDKTFDATSGCLKYVVRNIEKVFLSDFTRVLNDKVFNTREKKNIKHELMASIRGESIGGVSSSKELCEFKVGR